MTVLFLDKTAPFPMKARKWYPPVRYSRNASRARRRMLRNVAAVAVAAWVRPSYAGLLDRLVGGNQKDALALFRAAQNGSQEALDKLLKSSRGGDPWATMQFGYLYQIGRSPGTSAAMQPGYPPGGSIPIAMKSYLIAAGKMTPEGTISGNVFAAYNLGLIYLWGLDNGGNPQPEMAVRWFRAAANTATDKVFLPAVMHLAVIYENGFRSVPADLREAMLWYRKAAGAGEPTALLKWGVALVEGKGAEKNYFDGLVQLQRSAEKWQRDAMYYLASLNGMGSDYQERNIFAAAQWLWIAATGAPRYRAAADAMMGNLDKPTQQRVKQSARLWITGHMKIPPHIEYNAPLNEDVPDLLAS
ncbi:tetratricopeptide repeat protein [Burkholderia anthina]|uniref:tetratricopeptide repeat protein n=1 Tax=Burkholderia anthina TaxID=179879 RepID=UPI0037BE784F